MLWERTGAFRALKQGLATFTDAVDRIMSGRVPARCRWGDHKANVIFLEISPYSGDIVGQPQAVCSEHAYGWWKCATCDADAKDSERALILFSANDGIFCHTCMAAVPS